jgi:hypothetical protein
VIAAYLGVPGDCKTYSMTAWLLHEMHKGRLGVSNYAVHEAWPLEYLHDLLHDKYRGASVGLDEAGRILPARDWTNEDEVETAFFETHRHHGIQLRYSAQNVAQVSKGLRELTEWFIFCYRCGPDPSPILQTGKEPHWWQCPLLVKQVWVHRNNLPTDGLEPQTLGSEDKVKYIFWRREIAKAYDTTERIYHGALHAEIERRMAETSERISLHEPWDVQHGHALGTLTALYRARDEKAQRKLGAKHPTAPKQLAP